MKWGGKPYIVDGQGCIRLQLLREGQLFRALQDTVSAVRDNLSCPEAGSGPGGGRLDAVHVIAALLDDMEENREWPLQCCLPGKTGHILLFAGCTGGSLRRRWEIARDWGEWVFCAMQHVEESLLKISELAAAPFGKPGN